MLTKFDVRSSRVKGVSFHKQRPWVLCGLHNGIIQIWDYRMNSPVDTYAEHSGSVRGVDFHVSQPLFVSGADDYTIKVWNYKLRRCLFTLTGHMDYIRTTFFHLEQPWIVSSADDFTVRIWNWQSRASVACLPGHNHYVMCAQFHPREDLVVSASLDKTVRVWDIASLRLRKQESGITQDLLGTSDVMLKFQVEGHDKGVNWVSFHPTKPYIVSAADDRTVRTWRMTETSCHEDTQLRGHTANVCCAIYFKDFIISDSEDRTIRVWDVKQREPVMVFRREVDRYWILAALPSRNLIAAGHDSGLQVFKLFRERPAFTVTNNKILHYIHENILYTHNFDTKADYKFALSPHLYPPSSISCNPADNAAAVWYNTDGGITDLFVIPKPGFAVESDLRKRYNTTDAVFFSPNKYAFVDKNEKLSMFNLQGDKERPLESTFLCQHVYPGPVGCVVCQSDDKLYLYQVAQHGSIAEATVPGVKYVVWDKDFHKVAFISKNAITIMTKRFKPIAAIAETTVRMKSAVFDEARDILYFTTSNHIKYCNLRTGETSTISTLKNVAYLVKAVGDTIWVLTRDGKVVMRELDNLELNFKLKLQQHAYRDIIQIIQRKQLKGQALVGYLHKHGHSEIALHFVSDPLTRFNLALECGALDIAKQTAIELNQPSVWHRLVETGVKFGDIQLSQFASSKCGNYYAAGFLSLITGNMASLGHLVDTTEDNNFRLQYGFYLNDVQQRIQILVQAGQLPLAYTTAMSNGMADAGHAILEQMDPEVADRMRGVRYNTTSKDVRFPAGCTENWPTLQVEESVFARLLKEPGQFDAIADNELLPEAAGAGWDDDEDLLGEKAAGREDEGEEAEEADAGAGWDDDDLDIDVNAALRASAVPGAAAGAYTAPREQPPLAQHWAEFYSIAAFHVAAGSFDSALDLLKRQIGLADPTPLKESMQLLWTAVNAARPAVLVPSTTYSLTTRPPADEMTGRHAPALPNYLPVLTEKLRVGYQLFIEGRFADALATFEGILHQAVLTTVSDDKEQTVFREILQTAPEYARALSLQIYLRSLEPLSKEALESSLYFTHFKLHRAHQTLALSQAMSKAYKKKNYNIAAGVARRLLDQDPPKNKAQQAMAIIAEADRHPGDAVELDYDERNPFVLCSVSHKPMYKGNVEPTRCSFCHSAAHPSHKGTLCPICKIANFGSDCAGLNNRV